MRVPHRELASFVPALSKAAPDLVADSLVRLGFETELLEGEHVVYEIKVTPNRGDALSVLGIARELHAYLGRNKARSEPVLRLTDQSLVSRLETLEQPHISLMTDDCTQYHAVVFEDVVVQPSPAWLQQALALFGLRPINNVVDVTNYLMELYGQPLHAFDLDAILGGTMTLRHSKDGETLTTLDGAERKLGKGALVIEDREALIDLMGIMGGANSGVDHRTTRILVQSAIVTPAAIRRAMAAAKHTTDASYRYARGIDPTVSLPVLHEAIALLRKKEFGAAKAVGVLTPRTAPVAAGTIKLDYQRVSALLGTTTPKGEQVSLLERLGCSVEEQAGKPMLVTPPPWRADLAIWQDCAEEIARLIGLDDGIEAKRLPAADAAEPPLSDTVWAEGLKDRLVELGFAELLTYTFVSREDLAQFELPKVGELANPLNPQLQFLRPSLMPGLAAAIGKNSFYEPVLLFEVGHVFTAKAEQLRLGIAIASQKETLETWLARIADALGIDSSELKSAGTVATLGAAAAQHYRVRKAPAYIIEIPVDKLKVARRIPHKYKLPLTVARYHPISKYPPVVRDIAVVVPNRTDNSQIQTYIANFHPFVEDVTIFDEFTSPKLGEDKKSLAFHILFSSRDRTLQQVEIEEIETELHQGLGNSFDATIR